jgi:uncharacterized protein (DUF2147 family)
MDALNNCNGRRVVTNFKNLGLAALLALGFSSHAMADGGAAGTWLMENGKVTVRIAPCGGNLCGTIVALAKPLNKQGKPKVDKENPNSALRDRPIIGLTILSDMAPQSGNKWAGTIYNADDGRTYSSYMKLSGDRMKVKGCVAFICKSMNFTRVN